MPQKIRQLNEVITLQRIGVANRINSLQQFQPIQSNNARLDHDPATGSPLGILIENAATNLLSFNITDAPETKNITVIPGEYYTLSFWGTGTVTVNSQDIIGNGRFPSVRKTHTFKASSDIATISKIGFIDFPQLELGDIATSYISNLRNKEILTYNLLPTFATTNTNKGTAIIEFIPKQSLYTREIVSFSEELNADNHISIGIKNSGTESSILSIATKDNLELFSLNSNNKNILRNSIVEYKEISSTIPFRINKLKLFEDTFIGVGEAARLLFTDNGITFDQYQSTDISEFNDFIAHDDKIVIVGNKQGLNANISVFTTLNGFVRQSFLIEKDISSIEHITGNQYYIGSTTGEFYRIIINDITPDTFTQLTSIPNLGRINKIILFNGIITVGTTFGMYRSSDNGMSWQSTNVNQEIKDIYKYQNFFVAVGTSGGIYISEDSAIWTNVSINTDASVNCVTYSEKDNIWVVGLSDGSIYRSKDLVIWTSVKNQVYFYIKNVNKVWENPHLSSIVPERVSKIAVRIRLDDTAISINGRSAIQLDSISIPNATIMGTNVLVDALPFYGHTKDVKYYKEFKSNNELVQFSTVLEVPTLDVDSVGTELDVDNLDTPLQIE